jgi:hypothetical protein
MTREELSKGGKGKDADDGRYEPEDGSGNLWHTLRRAFCALEFLFLLCEALLTFLSRPSLLFLLPSLPSLPSPSVTLFSTLL